MSETTPKSPELIQAQIATFAAERVERYQDSGHIFNNLGSLAVEGVSDITSTTTSAEYHNDENGDNSLRVPEGTERSVATSAEYTDFLRSVGGSRYEAIRGRADMLQAYGRFEPTIARLRTELADLATRKQHPNFLGNGSNAAVFSIEEGDNKYAVRVPNGKGINPVVIDSHLAGAVLGRGVPHLEQIVAASYKDGVTVAEVMPGKEVGGLTVDEVKGISDDQLGELVDTLMAVNQRGIEIDPKPSNLFYDPAEGYGIVDYHSSKDASKDSKDQELGEIVGWMGMIIDNTGFYGKTYGSDKTIEDYAHDLEYKKANFDVMNRYRAIVKSKLGGEEQQNALTQIDKQLQVSQEAIDNYSNPQWVTECIARDEEWKRQTAEQAKKPAIEGWILTV